MKTKHTPGPWSVAADGVSVRQKADAWTTVAMPYTDGRDGPVLDVRDQAANARLIAAAPDLLEAAQEGIAAGKALMNIMSEMDAIAFTSAEMWLEQCGVKKGFGKRMQEAVAKAIGENSQQPTL
jgi:hypothetical protein